MDMPVWPKHFTYLEVRFLKICWLEVFHVEESVMKTDRNNNSVISLTFSLVNPTISSELMSDVR
jgi:hypothetical protein